MKNEITVTLNSRKLRSLVLTVKDNFKLFHQQFEYRQFKMILLTPEAEWRSGSVLGP